MHTILAFSQQRLQLWNLVPLAILWLTIHLLFAWNVPGDDLSSGYIAARLLDTAGESRLYAHDPVNFHEVDDPFWLETAQASKFTGFLHPYVQIPLWAHLIKPLADITDFPTFNRLFLGINLLALFSIVVLTIKLWCRVFDTPLALSTILTLFSFSAPVRYTIELNQTHPIFIALVLVAVWLGKRHRDGWAGMALAFATIIKVTPGLIAIYWLCTGRWRAFGAFVVSMAAFVGLSAIIADLTTNLAFVSNLQRLSGLTLVAFNNQSIVAWLTSYTVSWDKQFSWKVVAIPSAVHTLSQVMALTAFASVIWIFMKKKLAAEQFDRWGISAVLIIATVTPALAWTHYSILLVIPLLIMFHDALQSRQTLLITVAALIALLNYPPFAVEPISITVYDFSLLRSHLFSAGIAFVALLYSATIAERVAAPINRLLAPPESQTRNVPT